MTRQQAWARGAFRCVMRVREGQNPAVKKAGEYRTHCMGLPALLQQSGLVQALAFLWSRDKGGSEGAARQLCHDLAQVYGLGEQAGEKLLQQAYEAESLLDYVALSRDLMAVALWFRRFALSELPSQQEAGSGPHRSP